MIGTGTALLGAGVLGLGGALLSSNAAGRAADAQVAAGNRASATQLHMFNQMRGDLQPWMTTGAGAVNQLGRLYGLPANQMPGTSGAGIYSGQPGQNGGPMLMAQQGGSGGQPGQTAGMPDYSGFADSPDYRFAFDEGERALNRSLAAKHQLVSGNALKSASRFGQGMATQQYGNYFNRLLGIAGMGQSAAAGVGNAGIQTGANMGNAMMGAGQAQASGIVGQANAFSSAFGGIGNNLMLSNFMNRPSNGQLGQLGQLGQPLNLGSFMNQSTSSYGR